MQAIHGQPFDLIVLDLNMPGGHGLDVVAECRRVAPRTPVMVLTVHSEEEYAVRAVKLGASAFMTKDSEPEILLAAARRLLSGGRYIAPAVADALAARVARNESERPRHEDLSEREFQVLRRIGSGQRVGEIASELRLSVKTVSTYRARLLEKLNLRTTAQLTRYAIQHALTDDETGAKTPPLASVPESKRGHAR
jgi:DNA-binding NarL/FixJ family response regulator